MAAYEQIGFSREEGVLIPLVDKQKKALTFLEPSYEEQTNKTLSVIYDFGMEAAILQGKVDYSITIPVPSGRIARHFFDTDQSRFTVGTDDKKTFECRYVSHKHHSGLHFTRGSRQVGDYFRERLAVSVNEEVYYNDFKRYGTDSFLLFRLDESTYFLDYSQDILNPRQAVKNKDFTVLVEYAHVQSASKRAQREARENNWPFYPGLLEGNEPVPFLPYRTNEIVTIRRKGNKYRVVLETTLGSSRPLAGQK